MLSYFTGSEKQGPPAKKYSGFVGDCSDEQQEVLDQVKDWMKTNFSEESKDWNDHDTLRFCRARNFKAADV